MLIMSTAPTDSYREGWERTFGIKEKTTTSPDFVTGESKAVIYIRNENKITHFKCDLCRRQHPITSYFSWGNAKDLARVPDTIVSDKKDGKYFLRCTDECSKITHCDCCNKEATHKFTYSIGFYAGDEASPKPVNLLCKYHGDIFMCFAGSIGQLTKGLEL